MFENWLIYNLNLENFQCILEDWGEPRYRAEQIWHGLYIQLWDSSDKFTNIPISLREKLGGQFVFSHLEPISILYSADGFTTKILFRLPDGAAIEAVLMEYDKRRTLCISTQVGCAMGCVFCATGQMGLSRNLSSGEIVEQVLFYVRLLKERGEKVTNIVLMGMGEPFLNYDAVMSSIELLNHPEGLKIGSRRITISSVGIIPAIEKFTNEEKQVNLAISLHATDNDLRSSMLPINIKYPIDELIKVCRNYVKTTGRRITFEWALIQYLNDSPEQADELGILLKGLNCHVNIIPLNPTKGYAGKKSETIRVNEFKKKLDQHKIPCTIRVRRGLDIQAGCGQLAYNIIK